MAIYWDLSENVSDEKERIFVEQSGKVVVSLIEHLCPAGAAGSASKM
jgi:hypothetical protein